MNWIGIAFSLLLALSVWTPAAAQPAPSAQELCEAADVGPAQHMQFPAAEPVLQAERDYRAIFCTSAGAVYVDLYERQTPLTVNNFVFLAQEGYYDSSTFHRVIPNFMAQGGDPTGTGRGGPGYQFADEPVSYLTFDRPGLLAMANAGPGTNGSQFFITTAATPHLNYKHSIFGEVLLGQEFVESIRERDPQIAPEPGESLYTVLILSAEDAIDDSAVPAPEKATEAELGAAFDAFSASLPPSLPLDEERSGYLSTDALAATVNEDLRPGFMAFAEQYSHQYRHRAQVSNDSCDAAIYFSALGYWVDVFADAASAQAARDDSFMHEWLDSYGYAPDAGGNYRRHTETCAGEPGLHLLSLRAHGRFLITIDIVVAENVLEQVPSAEQLLQNLAFQIDSGFASIYRPELR